LSSIDRQLIRRLASGDASAAEAFVRRWHPKIRSWVAATVPYEDVDDYAQEVWVQLAKNQWHALLGWRGLDAEIDEPFSLSGYLWRITRHKVVDLLEKDGHQVPSGHEPEDVPDNLTALGLNPGNKAEGHFLRAAFDECTRHFKVRDSRLIVLWLEGQKDDYTARLLQMTPNNVRQRRRYLNRILRDCLGEKLPEYFSDV